jgi:hypothetical protein
MVEMEELTPSVQVSTSGTANTGGGGGGAGHLQVMEVHKMVAVQES